MGYMRHHAIIVTSFDEKLIKKTHDQANLIFNDISKIFISPENSYFTFFIPPDGSKEGWPESEVGDKQRMAFMDWCDSQAHSDGSNSISATEIRYTDDDGNREIERVT